MIHFSDHLFKCSNSTITIPQKWGGTPHKNKWGGTPHKNKWGGTPHKNK